jgi:hypothetical protein
MISTSRNSRWSRRISAITAFAGLALLIAMAGWLKAQSDAYQYELIARSGVQASGVENGVNFSAFTTPTISSDGSIVFAADYVGGFVPTSRNRGVYLSPSDTGTLQLLARKGDQVPQADTGVTYLSISAPAVGDSGYIAFKSTVTGTLVDSTNNTGLYGGPTSLIMNVARIGTDFPPGTPPGTRWETLDTPVNNGVGFVAFTGRINGGTSITDANNSGIWIQGLG